jgi:hypothetical protein
MRRRPLLRVPPLLARPLARPLAFLLALFLPLAPTAWATPSDARTATPPAPAVMEAEITALVERHLVRPLGEKEERRSRFSRSYIPPRARRVRILDRVRSTDPRGGEFVAFAVDDRAGRFALEAGEDSGRWRRDAIVGCAYPARDEIFIKRGDEFFAAGLLLGKKTAAADRTVCRPAPIAASR